MTEKKEVISIFVDNQANVLSRVVSLFGRRGFNIDSLTVSATNNPAISRITIAFTGNDQALNQIITQTEKLEVVKEIFTLEKEDSVYRELLLIKIRSNKSNRTALREVVEIFRGKIIDLSKESVVVEMTGAPEKIDGFMNMVSCYEIIEMCRTGVTGIKRGLATPECCQEGHEIYSGDLFD
ncbi:acetolactate synthase small subunit [Aminipila butyrica]|uniref:Acetolactate synthase small subunit n=1 Tax=Aminipila butyrica TaxID=433296 RepID=A0A858BSY6_9FIRM|nr:acetolactate synthase small subunit [Aminipila butyrica]QIB68060.1 acetolactate synthase small subunit [Aminipila butyrica]